MVVSDTPAPSLLPVFSNISLLLPLLPAPTYSKPKDKDHVRLADIDILGAIGDSDTAGFAARSSGIHSYFTDYVGASLSRGQTVTGRQRRPWQTS